jgi:hypothetical protein
MATATPWTLGWDRFEVHRAEALVDELRKESG